MRKFNDLVLGIMIGFLMVAALCTINASSMSLGLNLVSNSNFASPSIPSKQYSHSYNSISCWKFTNKCELIDIQLICKDYSPFCQSSNQQALNITASATTKKQINQTITLQNLTIHLEMFLSSIFEMQQNKGTLIQAVVETYSNQSFILEYINNGLLFLPNATAFKSNYQNPKILSKNPSGDNFFANSRNYFYYQLIVIRVIHFIGSFIFKVFFKYPISLPFIKYSFTGIYCVMMFEGNIEELFFYYLSQCKSLFSINFTHKIVNLVILFFGFLIVFYAFGCLLWFHSYYMLYEEGKIFYRRLLFMSSIICELIFRIRNYSNIFRSDSQFIA